MKIKMDVKCLFVGTLYIGTHPEKKGKMSTAYLFSS